VLIFYLLPVSIAAWFVGHRFAVFVSILSVAIWLAADIGAGATYHNKIILVWNATIVLGFFLVVTWLLATLRRSVLDLEARVRQRTLALTDEMAERMRLETEILEISEREQRRIGHDLHDGLGQHLTGTALAGQVLGDRLEARGLATEATETNRVVALIEEAIALTRTLAHGLSPVSVEVEGLNVALSQLAGITCAQFYLPCEFRCGPKVHVDNPATATHLYRITQEAISNAIRHGRTGRVDISLDADESGEGTVLTITDNGVGLDATSKRREGQGLRIMRHRARMINATLEVQSAPGGGTVVRCRVRPAQAPGAPVLR
jgi:signal transduction histidine kinase